MRPPWSDDPQDDLALIGQNSKDTLRSAVEHARRRQRPTVALVLGWHSTIFEGCRVPVDYYVGNFRDSDPDCPYLDGYRVGVGDYEGTTPADVPRAVNRFLDSVRVAIARLDGVIGPDEAPTTIAELDGILRLAGLAHGEWVRIHPFANGNGRTARLWANWVLARYGLRPVVRIRPRPIGTRYGAAAIESMQGNHVPMIHVIRDMLEEAARN